MFKVHGCNSAEFNVKLIKRCIELGTFCSLLLYIMDNALSFWVRGCPSPVGQRAGSVGHQQLIGNMKAATKQLPILDILCGGAAEAHDCVTNRLIMYML